MIALMASDGKVCLQPRSGKQYSLQRAVAQLGSALEWGSRGRGFKSRRPELTHVLRLRFAKCQDRSLICVHVRTSMNVFVVTTSATRKPHATASHGLWYTVKAFLVVPTPQERSAITNQVAVAMNSID